MRWIDAQTDEDLDPAFMLCDVQRPIDTDALPDDRTVLAFSFSDVEPEMRDWWLVLTPDEIDVCEHDPGFGTDIAIDIPLRTFTRIWRGDLQWDDAARAASLQVRGPTWLRRQVPTGSS